jgi:2-hydroxy-6-oxonona-2,4-dienedioate hydrolase
LRNSEARNRQAETGARIPGLQHANIELADGGLHYVRAGAGDALLLIHGGHGSWTHWIANIDRLSRTRRVIALDLPGFGASFNPQPAYSIKQYAGTISSVLDSLRIDRAAIAGFSFGCIVASATARREPERISHLALVNAPGIGPSSPNSRT